MGNTGFDTQFYIRRKRNLYALQFLMYLDGLQSNETEWPDSEDTEVDPAATDMQVAPYGYLPKDGAEYLSGNLGVNGVTITEFTIAVVLSRNENANNEGIFYGLFGTTHYPRLYFVGTALHAEIKLDGTAKTITVNNVDTYLKPGQPAFIVFRGSAATGIEVLIDGVSRGTQTDTGTAFTTSSSAFKLAKDTNLSYFQKGALRLVAACAAKLTDAQISAWRTMLEYEGFFDLWRDNFAKWTGDDTFSSGVQDVSGSPYQATIVEVH